MATITMYLTDKTEARFWVTYCGAGYSSGERHNLERHLAMIKSGHKAYANVEIDRETARLVVPSDELDLSPEAIAKWLTDGDD